MELVEPVNSIIKDMSRIKLLPTTVSAYPVYCVCFCHLLNTQHYLLSNGGYGPPLAATLPRHQTYPYHPHPLIYTAHNNTVAVKEVVEKNVVLYL